jgi:hypothetical protein
VNSLHGARVENRKQQIREQIKGFQNGEGQAKLVSREEYANKLKKG